MSTGPTKNIEVYPCPWCGGMPEVRNRPVDIGGTLSRDIYFVRCVSTNCAINPKVYVEGECCQSHLNVRTNEEAEELAKKKWNSYIWNSYMKVDSPTSDQRECPTEESAKEKWINYMKAARVWPTEDVLFSWYISKIAYNGKPKEIEEALRSFRDENLLELHDIFYRDYPEFRNVYLPSFSEKDSMP